MIVQKRRAVERKVQKMRLKDELKRVQLMKSVIKTQHSPSYLRDLKLASFHSVNMKYNLTSSPLVDLSSPNIVQ